MMDPTTTEPRFPQVIIIIKGREHLLPPHRFKQGNQRRLLKGEDNSSIIRL